MRSPPLTSWVGAPTTRARTSFPPQMPGTARSRAASGSRPRLGSLLRSLSGWMVVMTTMGTIGGGPVTQIAWVTADIEATEKFLSAGFGAGNWTRMNDIHFAPEDCTLRGEPADFTIHVSI